MLITKRSWLWLEINLQGGRSLTQNGQAKWSKTE